MLIQAFPEVVFMPPPLASDLLINFWALKVKGQGHAMT